LPIGKKKKARQRVRPRRAFADLADDLDGAAELFVALFALVELVEDLRQFLRALLVQRSRNTLSQPCN
jgi:hypothetical protein